MQIIPPRLLHIVFTCYFCQIYAYKCFPVFSSNQQLKYSTLKKKVAELIKVTQGTQASPSMFSEKRSHAW